MLGTTNSFYKFLLYFFVTFLGCYYGFKVLSGAAVEGGLYSNFIHNYFNITSWIRQGLIFCTQQFLGFFNINSVKESEYILRANANSGIKLVYGCLGIAVYSFWVAYIVASIATVKNKIIWFFIGLLSLWAINVVRISLVLLAQINKWAFPLGMDHHTWFNIVSYFFILILIFLFERKIRVVTKKVINES